jgi:ABC-2 type transport system permease protein
VRTVRSYGLLIRWQALRLKDFLPLAIVVQVLFSFGIVVGYPLLFPEIDQLTILYLATGAPAITLITMGLVALPQVVAQAKTEGSLEYMRSLPVSRLVFLAADLTVWLAIVLPGVVFSVLVGAWAFDLSLAVSWTIIPASLLVATTAAAVGYAMASLLPPMIAMLLTQVLIIGVLVFSPIDFPAERLPEWLQAVHAFLPVAAMGEVMRGSLAETTFPLSLGPFLLLGVWCAVCLGITYLTLRRRA